MKANTILMNFTEAKREAQNLREIAAGIRKLAQKKLNDSVNNLSAGWQGSSADAYLTKVKDVQNKMAKLASNIEKTANTIEQNAKTIYDAEMKALEIATVRIEKV